MRVVITNSQLYNGGDAAIMRGIIKILRQTFGTATEIIIFDPDADGARLYYSDLQVEQMAWPTFYRIPRWRRWPLTRLGFGFHRLRFTYFAGLLTAPERRAFDLVRSADLVISTGGTYLVEHYDMRARLFELYVALFARKPPILFTQSLGPFRQPGNQRALREICAASPLVLLRDAKSKRNLIEIGVAPHKLTVAADAGFALAEPAALASAARAQTQVKRVAISVRSWRNFETRSAQEGMGVYRRALANAVEWLVQTLDAEIVFVSTCQGIDEYWARDCDVALEIAGDLAPRVRERVSVDQQFHTPEQLLEMIGGFDLVIATRMHMAILALAAGVPVLPIAYEFKTQELFANELGMSEWVLSIDTLTEQSIALMLEKFLDNLPKLRPSLFAAVARQHERAIGIGALLHPLGERASLQVGMRLGAAA